MIWVRFISGIGQLGTAIASIDDFLFKIIRPLINLIAYELFGNVVANHRMSY